MTEVIVSEVILLDGRKPDMPTESLDPAENVEAVAPSALPTHRSSAAMPAGAVAESGVSASGRPTTPVRTMARRSAIPEEDLPL